MTKLFSIIPSITNYTFTEGRICYDAIVNTDKNETILVETKVRNIEIDKYDEYILELQKLISLINRKKKNNYNKIYYINFFPHENSAMQQFIIFDLTPRIEDWKLIQPEIIKKYMNKATCDGDDKVVKEIIMLRYNDKTDCKGIFALN
jgi:hypothetical protein